METELKPCFPPHEKGKWKLTSRKAFTLIEILVVIVITGVILTAAMAPMVLTIRGLRSTEKDFGAREAMWKTLAFLGKELRQTATGPEGAVFRLNRGERMGGKADDSVCFWISPSSLSSYVPGTVVYRTIVDKVEIPGLYRFSFPSMEPSMVECREFPEEGYQLVLPYADSLRVSVWDGKTWVEEYEGPRPAGIRITLERRGEMVEYVDWIPK